MKPKLNIFENVAEALIEERNMAFKDNSRSTNYFELLHATDKTIGRKFPQTDFIELLKAHALKNDKLSNISLKFDRIELYKSAKLSDCISTGAFSRNAILLSRKALEIFEKFSLGNYKIYDAKVYHNYEEYEYGVLHFVNNLQNLIDFKLSTFYVSDVLGSYEFDIEIISEKDYEEKVQLVKNRKLPKKDNYGSINLKLGIFKENPQIKTLPDIFTISSSAIGPYISKDLAQAIISNNLSGFEIKEIYNIQD